MSGDLVQEILAIANELTLDQVQMEYVNCWSRSKNKKQRRFRVETPSLLKQLYYSGVDPEVRVQEIMISRPKASSRPPLALEAFGRWLEIDREVECWVRTMGMLVRDSIEENIQALVGASSVQDYDTQDALLRDFKTWRRWAGVMAGWRTDATFNTVRDCPECDKSGGVWVNVAAHEAYCLDCRSTWSRAGLLAFAEKSAA